MIAGWTRLADGIGKAVLVDVSKVVAIESRKYSGHVVLDVRAGLGATIALSWPDTLAGREARAAMAKQLSGILVEDKDLSDV